MFSAYFCTVNIFFYFLIDDEVKIPDVEKVHVVLNILDLRTRKA